MKRAMMMICAAMVIALWSVPVHAEYWDEGNDGDSWETAYVIDSVEDFIFMRNGRIAEDEAGRRELKYDNGKYFKLTRDLDITSKDLEYAPRFIGHFDGQNHTINVEAHGEMLFGNVSGDSSVIRNLNVEGHVYGENFVGGISSGLNIGTIENCSFTGTIESVQTGVSAHYAGGIVSHTGVYNNNELYGSACVRNCTFKGTIKASGGEAGGIVGCIYSGDVENCTVQSGSEIHSSEAGGIVGAAGMGISSMGAGEMLGKGHITGCISYAELFNEGPNNNRLKGGIAGNVRDAGDRIQLSGNTWPPQYPEIGNPSPANTPIVAPDTPVSPDQPATAGLPIGLIQTVTLSQDTLRKIASAVSADPSQLRTLSSDNITAPQEPTQAMRDYVRAEETQLTGKFNTLSVDTSGWYTFKVSLSDELFSQVQGQNVSSYKFYGLHDSESQLNASLVNGLLGTWEVFSLNGDKLDSFGVKEFLMVGFLDAGTPFSVYLTKILLALLAGGCDSGLFAGSLAILALLILTLRRH